MARMRFVKEGDAVWISHLDLMRVLQRAFRRAGLLLKHSQGFTPHPCLSIAMPLSVGVSSDYEIAEFELEDPEAVLIPAVAGLLNPVLPEGIRILETYDGGEKLKHLKWLEAELTLVYDAGVPQDAPNCIRALFSRPSLIVEKHSKKGPVEVDIQPMHKDTSVKQKDEHTVVIHTIVSAQEPTLNPLLMITALERHVPDCKPDFSRCCRLCLYNESMRPFS